MSLAQENKLNGLLPTELARPWLVQWPGRLATKAYLCLPTRRQSVYPKGVVVPLRGLDLYVHI
jgi:hypothetical protein